MADDAKRYTLIAADGEPYSSPQKGAAGDHRGSKIFGHQLLRRRRPPRHAPG
jgi:hypothetical protein